MRGDCNWRHLSPRNGAVDSSFPLLGRFVSKFVLDILPAALASVIGGFLFTQYQFGRAAPPAQEQVTPASAEVLALVRDEHAAIIGFLKAQTAAEKSRLAAEDAETARAVADAKAAQEDEAREKAAAEQNAADTKLAVTAVLASPGHRVGATSMAQVVLPRRKPASVPEAAPAQAAAAQPEQIPQQSPASPPADRLARDPDSLLAKTLDLKDHVVAATKQAVAAIGDMFASVGERLGNGTAPTARPFSSDS